MDVHFIELGWTFQNEKRLAQASEVPEEAAGTTVTEASPCNGWRISRHVQASLLEYEELCNEAVLDGNGQWQIL